MPKAVAMDIGTGMSSATRHAPCSHRSISQHDGQGADDWFDYFCGHCGKQVVGAVVASLHGSVKWLLCPGCNNGSVLTRGGTVYPMRLRGEDIDGLPPLVANAYREARAALSAGASVACELVCRTILMHIAVDKGADEGLKFQEYLAFLETAGYITPPMKQWADLIRTHGNKAAHELEVIESKRAESTLLFVAELLRVIYEMESRAKTYIGR